MAHSLGQCGTKVNSLNLMVSISRSWQREQHSREGKSILRIGCGVAEAGVTYIHCPIMALSHVRCYILAPGSTADGETLILLPAGLQTDLRKGENLQLLSLATRYSLPNNI